ncbi:T9SS type A sorting domain-containing protein [Winogradskyella undariae]|uniref:T9SS type A sorting domain-containing protein n=1 Tax=Winogradskyella undariae TaxID=1285465 RepID=UPI00156ACAD0|nr:T9SS type A sorting domain-containing protein [Winogradskyella undariae]NRR91419.1 T9SS type A sorting domain-containing protein [Winogradskyella undariae]
MKQLLLLTILIFSKSLSAQTIYTYTGIGDWTEETNWSPNYPGIIISETDEAIISTDSEVSLLYGTINGKLTINGELETSSTLTINGELTINGYLNNRSTLTINGTATNNGTHLSSSFLRIYGQYTNKETLTLNSFSYIYPDGVLNNETSMTSILFYNDGTLNNTGTYINNSSLYGNNNIHTSDFVNTKNLIPGSNSNSIGTYNFDANLSLISSATLTTEIESTTEVDLVNVNETATIGGKLKVNLLEDYDPAIGTTYTILQANAITGTFSSIEYPDLGTNKEFSITYNTDNIVLEVVESTLSIGSDNELNSVIIYPNPTSSVLNINNTNTVSQIAIYSVLGQKIKTLTLSIGNNSIDVSHLKKGVYMLLIDKNLYKFIKN